MNILGVHSLLNLRVVNRSIITNLIVIGGAEGTLIGGPVPLKLSVYLYFSIVRLLDVAGAGLLVDEADDAGVSLRIWVELGGLAARLAPPRIAHGIFQLVFDRLNALPARLPHGLGAHAGLFLRHDVLDLLVQELLTSSGLLGIAWVGRLRATLVPFHGSLLDAV